MCELILSVGEKLRLGEDEGPVTIEVLADGVRVTYGADHNDCHFDPCDACMERARDRALDAREG